MGQSGGRRRRGIDDWLVGDRYDGERWVQSGWLVRNQERKGKVTWWALLNMLSNCYERLRGMRWRRRKSYGPLETRDLRGLEGLSIRYHINLSPDTFASVSPSAVWSVQQMASELKTIIWRDKLKAKASPFPMEKLKLSYELLTCCILTFLADTTSFLCLLEDSPNIWLWSVWSPSAIPLSISAGLKMINDRSSYTRGNNAFKTK